MTDRSGRPGSPLVLRIALLALCVAPATLAAAPPERVEVTGEVTDEEGAPLAGARVTLHPGVSPAERGALWLAGRQYPDPVARARTGADGVYRLVVPDSETPLWTVVARTAKHVPMERAVGPLFGSIHLEAARLVARVPTTVRVVGSDSEPVRGTAVLLRVSPFARRITQGGDSWGPPAARVARTGEDGGAGLVRADGEDGRVEAAETGRLAVAELKGADLLLTLPAAGGRSLRVVGPDGEPARGVLAWWAPDGLPAVGERIDGSLPVARYRLVPVAAGGEDGSLLLPTGLPEDAVVRLAAPDGAWGSPPPADREPEPGQPVEVRLQPPVTLTGTVRERESGTTVADAVIWAESDRSVVARSDDEGRYRLTLPGPEGTGVSAAGPHHQPAVPGVAVYGESASELVLAVDPVLALTGRVESQDGVPLEGATIVAQPSVMTLRGHGMDCGRARVPSGAGGRFRLPGLTPHCDYHLSAWQKGYATARLDVPPLADDAPGYEPVRLVLPAGRTLAGRVVDPDGVPVPEARVRFYRYTPWIQYASYPFLETRRRVARSDSGGLFRIDHVAGARGRVVVEADGFLRFERESVEVPDEPGETDLGDLELEPEQVLELQVVDADGAPVEGATVFAFPSSPRALFDTDIVSGTDVEELADASGRYRIGGFRKGDRARVRVSKEGHVSRTVEGVRVPEDSPVRIVMVPGAVVTGRVLDGSGRAVTEAVVSTDERGGPGLLPSRFHGPGAVDEGGRFELGDLAAGPVTLFAHGPDGGRSAGVLLELEAGEHEDGVELILRSRPSILGRVVAPDGSPVPDPTVSATGQRRGGGPCRSAADGSFRCPDRDPGTYTVIARESGVGQVEVEVVLGDTDVTVDLFLEPELVISGRVVSADGRPVPNRSVALSGSGAGSVGMVEAGTGEDGSFVFQGVTEGTYELLVASSSNPMGLLSPHRHPEPIVVRQGLSVTGLEVRLERTSTLRGTLLGLSEDEALQAVVVAQRPDIAGWPLTVAGQVSEGGRYEVPGVGPGTWTVVAAGPDGMSQARSEIEILPGDEEPVLDLHLSRGITLMGRVLLGGEPWSGVMIRAGEPAVSMATANVHGRFELAGVAPGRQELVLIGSSGLSGGSVVLVREVMVEEGREVVIDVAVGRVRGLVMTSVGPLADARVRIDPVSASAIVSAFPRVVSSTADGRFLIDRVPVGSYVITVGKAGHVANSRELHVTAGEVELPPVVLAPAPP